MANTFTAPFAQTSKVWNAVATTATALTGANSVADNTPANTVLLGTAGTDGGIITSIGAIPRATVTATALYIWSSLDSGTTKHLVASALMPAYTLAATTENARTVFKHADGTVISESSPLRVQSGEKLYVGVGVTLASGIVFSARETDF